jgi:ubiquinol-cytochrome c reductase cytochrome c1 subunit
MIRLLAILVGLGFLAATGCSFINGFGAWVSTPVEQTAEQKHHEHAHHEEWSFSGPFGHFDRAQLQRGFKVYKEACSGCHSLKYVAFRNLEDLGYSEAEVRAIADQWQMQVPSINPTDGAAATRKALPSDTFPRPFANDTEARSRNNNAVPPDLSLIVKAREGGANYIHSLLTGYGKAAPADVEVGPGLHYNPYFHSLAIAMPPPLNSDGQVTYTDGTQATVDQMARDVVAFLQWAAEPTLEKRNQLGWAVLMFLLVATILAFLAYKNVWADKKVKKKKGAAAD